MKFAPLIWAALVRRPAEAVLTWLAVIVAFTLFGMMAGLDAGYHRAVDVARMDRLYVTPRFPSVDSGSGTFGFPIGLLEKLERVDGVAGVGAFRVLFGYRGDQSNRAFIYAVTEGMRYGWSELPVAPDQWDELFATPTGLLVSRKAADKFGLKRGDSFSIVGPSDVREDGSTGWDFRVVDVLEGEDPEWPNGLMVGNFRYLDNSLPKDKRGIVRGFRLAVSKADLANVVAARIDRTFANSETPTLSIPAKTNAQNLANSGLAIASISWIVAGAGLFMVLFLVANGIAQSISERLPEFAVLRSVGFSDANMRLIVLAEALIPCVGGAIIGMGAAFLLRYWPTHFIPGSFAALPAPTLTPFVLLWALACAVLLASASVLAPAFQLSRVNIIEVLGRR